jgi:IclR family transcriptional regulator, acetate operon repressor
VLLADLPADTLDLFLAEPLEAFTTRTITEAAAFRRELGRVRQRGHAVSSEELEPGFVAVGAPVRAASGRVVAALSLGGPKVRLTPERVEAFVEALVDSAGRASERLGYKPERRIGRAG